MVSHGNPESELNIANAELERLVMEAYQQRKRVLDSTRRQELKNSIWRQRIKVAELEQNYAGHLLVQAQRDIEKAAISQDQEGYTEAYRRLVRLRIR